MNIHILGNQQEPTLTMNGYEITDFEVRTKDEDVFEQGKIIINDYVAKNPEFEQCQLFIDDPMTVGLYPRNNKGCAFNKLVLKLESLGFYGKAAGYAEA